MFYFFGWKVEDGEIAEGAFEAASDAGQRDLASGVGDDACANSNSSQGEKNPSNWSQKAGNQRPSRMVKKLCAFLLECALCLIFYLSWMSAYLVWFVFDYLGFWNPSCWACTESVA